MSRAAFYSAASFTALLLLACLVYGRVFEIRPLSDDNLYAFSWAEQAPASTLLQVDPDVYPEWRPLAYLTMWLQYRWAGIDQIWTYVVVNLLLWTTCGWLVYRIVVLLSQSMGAGLLAAAVVIADPRPAFAMTWIVERQTSMACLFGLIALLMVIKAGDQRVVRLRWLGLAALLLASALSKEYGLAFAGAVAVYSLRERRYDVATAAIAAALVYAGMRIAFAGGATGRYCDPMGFFFVVNDVCLDRLDVAGLTQMAYNVAANGVGSVLPGIVMGEGQIGVMPFRLALSGIWMAAAMLGWLKGPRWMRLTILVVVFNTLLGFVVYRDRNQVVALCAFGVAVGVGLALADAVLRTSSWRRSRRVRALAATILLGLLTVRAIRTRRVVASEVDQLLDQDPCSQFTDIHHLDAALVRRIKIKYNMTNPECR